MRLLPKYKNSTLLSECRLSHCFEFHRMHHLSLTHHCHFFSAIPLDHGDSASVVLALHYIFLKILFYAVAVFLDKWWCHCCKNIKILHCFQMCLSSIFVCFCTEAPSYHLKSTQVYTIHSWMANNPQFSKLNWKCSYFSWIFCSDGVSASPALNFSL